MNTAQAVLAELREGNQRFVADVQSGVMSSVKQQSYELTQEHVPAAIIVGCSDARVPAEMIFDQGVGQLFVVRTAGNIVTESQMGSVEFAAAKFGAQLAVVLGHTECGAVAATLNSIIDDDSAISSSLEIIVNAIRPAVEPLVAATDSQREDLMPQAVRANIAASVTRLRNDSEILKSLIDQRKFQVVGAEYSLQTGQVEFFDDI